MRARNANLTSTTPPPVPFVFRGLYAEHAKSAVKQPAIRTTSRLMMLTAIPNPRMTSLT